MKTFISLLLLFSTSLYAAEDITFELINDEAGIIEDPYSIVNDAYSAAILGHIGASPDSAGGLYAAEAAFSFKLKTIWMEMIIGKVQGDFKSMFGDQNSTKDSTSPSDAQESMLTGGVGLGYRFNYIQEMLGSNKWYETSKAYLTYNILDEEYTGEQFQGLGIRGDYTVQYRFSPKNYVGLRASYHVAALKRSRMENESTTYDPTLTYSAFTMAFEYGVYF